MLKVVSRARIGWWRGSRLLAFVGFWWKFIDQTFHCWTINSAPLSAKQRANLKALAWSKLPTYLIKKKSPGLLRTGVTRGWLYWQEVVKSMIVCRIIVGLYRTCALLWNHFIFLNKIQLPELVVQQNYLTCSQSQNNWFYPQAKIDFGPIEKLRSDAQ